MGLVQVASLKARKKNSTEVTNLLRKEPRNSLIVQLKYRYGNESIFVHKDYAKKYLSMNKEELRELIDDMRK